MTLIPIMIPLQAGQAPMIQPGGLPWELVRRGFADYLNHTGTIASRAISENMLRLGIVSRAAKHADTFASLYSRTVSHIFIEQVQVETVAKAFRIVNSLAGYRSRGYY